MASNDMLKVPTITDVARKAKVSISTVSRVLNKKLDCKIKDETQKRVIKAARELNYQASKIAKGLKLKRTFTLAIFISDIADIFSHEVIKGVEKAANEEEYSVLISHMEGGIIKDLQMNMVRGRRIDGLLIDWAYKEDESLKELTKAGIPLMLINRRTDLTNNYVTTDYFLATKIAMGHLFGLGHQNIALLPGHLINDNSLLRLKGYRRCLLDNGLPYDNKLVEESGFSYADGNEAIKSLLRNNRFFTAIFCNNLMVAVGAINELDKAGIKVPEDVSVIACHDAPLSELIRPTVTTVKMPLFELGYETTKLLLNKINSKNTLNDLPRILPPIGLVIRESTTKANVKSVMHEILTRE